MVSEGRAEIWLGGVVTNLGVKLRGISGSCDITLSENTGKVKVASNGTFKIPQLPFFYLKMTLLSVSRCGAVVMAELKSVFAVREANQSAARLQPLL